MRLKLGYRNREFQVTLIDEHPFMVRLKENDSEEILELSLKENSSEGRVQLNGIMVPYFVTHESEHIWVTLDGQTFCFHRLHGERSEQSSSPGGFQAPMPCKVLNVNVSKGDRVSKGDVLIVMEAMKMEHRIEAPSDGQITAIHAKSGELVAQGFELLEFKAE